MQWCAVSEARAEVKQKRQHRPVGIHCFAQGCLYRFAKHHKCDANAFAVHTSQLRGTHFGMQMSYLMLQLTECCIIPSVHQCICVSHKKRNYWKRGKIKRELYCFKVCCTSFSFQFLLVHSSWPSAPLGLGLSLNRSMMVKMGRLSSLAHTRACRCKVSSSPAPRTIFGWNFPPTRTQQRQASGSHTTVSHILLLGEEGAEVEAEDPKAFPNEWICPRFRSQTLHVAGFKRKF